MSSFLNTNQTKFSPVAPAPLQQWTARPFGETETEDQDTKDLQTQLSHAALFGHGLSAPQPIQRQGELDTDLDKEEESLIQAKLTIGQPNDKYEQEATQVTAKVMRMPEGGLEQENDTLQAKPDIQAKVGAPAIPENFETQLGQHKGDGRPLPDETRAYMEPRFGEDLGNVRVHEVPTLASGIQAQTFTHAQDIYFNAGKYKPESSEGKGLLAHEFTHTLQQNNTISSALISPQKSSKTKEGDTFGEWLRYSGFANLKKQRTLKKGYKFILYTCKNNSEEWVKVTNRKNIQWNSPDKYFRWHLYKDGEYKSRETISTIISKYKSVSTPKKAKSNGFDTNNKKKPGEVEAPQSPYNPYTSQIPNFKVLKDGQWYSFDRSNNPRNPQKTFWKASIYNAKHNNYWAYRTIAQRHAFYEFADAYLNTVDKATKSQWFEAAAIVTDSNAVGAAENLNLWFLSKHTEKFLSAGNKFLFKFNMNNFRYLMEGKDIPDPKLKGLKGKALDNALVEFEQTKVQEFIKNYKGDGSLNKMIEQINNTFNLPFLPPDEVEKAIEQKFDSKGIKFNFSKCKHRVILGQKIITNLYKERVIAK